MTACDAGAPSHAERMWLQADWRLIQEVVKRLQTRIAKATMEGRWGKVNSLQRLLTRSHSGKMLAMKRVTENRGKRTPGVDGQVWSGPASKWNAMKSMQHRQYRAHLHPQEQRQEASAGNSPHALQINAGVVEARPGTCFRELGGPEFLWISTQTLDCRRHRILLYHAGNTQIANLGSGRRHPWLFRQF